MALYRLIRRYTTLGGAVVEIRRNRLLRYAGWQCTGCVQGDGGHIRYLRQFENQANDHARNCRALPSTI